MKRMISVKKGSDSKKTKKEKAEMEPQFCRSVTGDEVRNYRVYYMKPLEKMAYGVLAFIVGSAVAYLFYGGIGKDEFGAPTLTTYIIDVVAMLLCGGAAVKMFIPIRTQQLRGNAQRKLKMQFRDMLEAMVTAFGAGKNVTDAFSSVYGDMCNQYEENAFIVKELACINSGIINGFTVEELLQDLGKRSGCEDIVNFADVFDICYRQGGNIKETVKNTCVIISDKMSVAEDIETIVSGSKSEQNIMLVMPIALVAIIKLSSPEFGENFATPAGIIATTVGIVMFVASYFIGKKLLEIKI